MREGTDGYHDNARDERLQTPQWIRSFIEGARNVVDDVKTNVQLVGFNAVKALIPVAAALAVLALGGCDPNASATDITGGQNSSDASTAQSGSSSSTTDKTPLTNNPNLPREDSPAANGGGSSEAAKTTGTVTYDTGINATDIDKSNKMLGQMDVYNYLVYSPSMANPSDPAGGYSWTEVSGGGARLIFQTEVNGHAVSITVNYFDMSGTEDKILVDNKSVDTIALTDSVAVSNVPITLTAGNSAGVSSGSLTLDELTYQYIINATK